MLTGPREIANRSRIRAIVFFVLTVVALIGWAAPAAAQRATLFGDDLGPPGSGVGLVNRPATREPMVVRSRETDVEVALLVDARATGGFAPQAAARSVVLNLFRNAEYIAVLDRVEMVSTIGYAWVGTINGIESSQVVLAVSDGVFTGSINVGTTLYTVRPVGSDKYAIAEVDRTAIPPDGPPLPPSRDVTSPRGPRAAPASPTADTAALESGDAFDLLIYYTTATKNGVGGVPAMNSLITASVALVNAAYVASGIPVSARLVAALETGYVESGSTLTDLETFRADPNVQAGRDRYAADLVSLITNSSTDGFGGRAYITYMFTNDPSAGAYSVVVRYAWVGLYGLTHELGHNQGAHHEPGNGCPGVFPYSCGYTDKVNRFYTIMSYGGGCSNCRLLNQFSSPVVTFQGHVTGTATQDNARTLRETRVAVANFRQASTAPIGSPSGLLASTDGSAVLLRWVAPSVGVARSYVIEAGSASGLANLASFDTGNATTSFRASGVATGSYYLRVKATDGMTVSAASNEVLLIVGSLAPVGAPSSLF